MQAKQNEKPLTFYCRGCPKCGKKGIPRGQGKEAYCVCPEHGKYDATFTNDEDAAKVKQTLQGEGRVFAFSGEEA